MLKVLFVQLDRQLVAALLWVISLYQCLLSPFLGNACRFHPSCSHYAKQAIQQHGPFFGILMTVFRICRCNPLCEGGVDPVPKELHVSSCFHSTTKRSANDGSQT